MYRMIALVVALAVLGAGCGRDTPASSQPPGSADETTATSSTAVVPSGEAARLIGVFDGDSIEVEVSGSVTEVRLVGINAPERDECHGAAGREALAELLADARITLVPAGDEDRDRFGRLLRYVYADDAPVAEQLLDAGHANVLQGDHERDDLFVSLADTAAAAGHGMWRADACGPTTGAAVEIAAVEYDPPGRDRDNADGEYIVIRNDGSEPIDLTDWIVRDESSQHRYRVAVVALAPGAELRIRSGCGTDGNDDVFWCAGDAVWSNGGDTVLLQDPRGNVVGRLLYRGDY